MQRCYNPKRENYSIYGGRGITICQEWLDDPNSFIDWALNNGFQRHLSIDRIDSNKKYAPENCRWATRQQQSRNTRFNTTNFEKGTRICQICKVEKPLTEFSRNRSRPKGRNYLCKPCEATSKRRRGYRH